jgi:hypothetical protein
MSHFNRRTFSINDLPDLTLGKDSVRIDIGFLGGEEHREAFSAILEKLLSDNRTIFDEGARLLRIDAANRVSSDQIGVPSFPAQLSALDRIHLGRALYDSRNEDVVLHVQPSQAAAVDLQIRFDNPAFWLDAPAV